MKSLLEQTVEKHYDDLAANDLKAQKRLAIGYQRSIDALEKEIKKLESGITIEGITDSKTFQYNRMQILVTDAGKAFGELGAITGQVLTDAQKTAVALAEKHVENFIGSSPLGIPRSFATLPRNAISQMVGSLGDGSPLRALTDSFAGNASKAVNRLLLEGVALGLNPNQTARRIASEMQGQLVRARTIARTETMRVYREAGRRSMVANKDVVKGWIWFSALDRRTCPVCWAMHGKKFKLRESMATHPNCRCTMVPETYTWKELGFNINELPLDSRFQPGELQFTSLPTVDKQFILGKGGYNAWINNLVTLDDFVLDTFSPAWGYGRTTKPLSKMVGKDNARLLAQGKLPPNFNPKSFHYDPPNFADPFNLQKINLDDALATGKLPQATADDIIKSLNEGKFLDPAEMDEAIRFAKEQPFTEVEQLANFALDEGAITHETWGNIIDQLVSGDPSVLDKIRFQLEKDIADKKHEIELVFQTKKQEALSELEKAVKLGNETPETAQFIRDYLHKLDNSPGAMQSLENTIANYRTKNFANNPFTELKTTLDEAFSKGLISDTQYHSFMAGADSGYLTHSEAKSITNVYKKKLAENTPISGSPITYAAEDWAKVTDLYNSGKLTSTEYDALYNSFYKGDYTPKAFKEYVDDLVTSKTKITKSSSQLLDELNNSFYPDAYKQKIAQQYKSKIINKEQMQDILDAAPNAAPKVKTPYKKHLQTMDSLKAEGIINQSYIDQILDGYAKGYLKNADIEKMLQQKAANFVAGSKNASNLPHPKVLRNTWDSEGFIGHGYRGSGGRGSKYYQDWKNRSIGADTQAITNYTNSLYDELNKWLRMGQPDETTWKSTAGYRGHSVAQLKKFAAEIDHAMKTTSVPEDMVVIRNSRASIKRAPDWANPQPGATIWDDGYMSTSAKSDWNGFSTCGDGFSSVAFQLVLAIPQGGKGLYVAPISSHSEFEMMIPRGAPMKIIEVEEFTDSCGHTAKRIYAELLP
jgi:SPP1 gp7 family putative phage head morphogenesis protein